MVALPKGWVLLAAIALSGLVLVAGYLAFFESQDTNLSQEEAVEAAKENAGAIIHDEPVVDTQVERTSYADAAEELGFGGDTPPEASVWRVVFRGMFFEPQGPPDPPSPPPPRKPVCAEITVLVEDATAQGLGLTFARSTGC